jgi:hypothetical protein
MINRDAAGRGGSFALGYYWLQAAAFLALFVVFEPPNLFQDLWKLNVIFGSFLILVISIGRISLTVNRLYRCPACSTCQGRGPWSIA